MCVSSSFFSSFSSYNCRQCLFLCPFSFFFVDQHRQFVCSILLFFLFIAFASSSVSVCTCVSFSTRWLCSRTLFLFLLHQPIARLPPPARPKYIQVYTLINTVLIIFCLFFFHSHTFLLNYYFRCLLLLLLPYSFIIKDELIYIKMTNNNNWKMDINDEYQQGK